MAGSAIPTTVASSAAIRDPSTAAVSTHRPTGLGCRGPGIPVSGGVAGLATRYPEMACRVTDVNHSLSIGETAAGLSGRPGVEHSGNHCGEHSGNIAPTRYPTCPVQGMMLYGDRPHALRNTLAPRSEAGAGAGTKRTGLGNLRRI